MGGADQPGSGAAASMVDTAHHPGSAQLPPSDPSATDAVVTCPKLASVLLDPERMVFPPPEVCATGADAIVRCLRAIATGDSVTCNIVKLVTVGGPFEGKSSLVDLLRRV